MVYTYTGTPGSGKSLHTAHVILRNIKNTRIICNFPINTDYIKPKYRNNFYFIPDSELTPHYLFEFAKAFHKEKRESQTMIIIDEAQRLFPIDRVYERRREWEQFFQLHRHLGYDIVLVTQQMSYINKGIRIQTEYEIKHRKVNNYGLGGLLIGLILHLTLFVSLTYWQGTKEKISSEFFFYRKKFGRLYDTFSNFDSLFNIPDNNTIDLGDSLSEADPEDDEDQREEIDVDGADFDIENFESYEWDLEISEYDMKRLNVS